jgi:hypothetical protein
METISHLGNTSKPLNFFNMLMALLAVLAWSCEMKSRLPVTPPALRGSAAALFLP